MDKKEIGYKLYAGIAALCQIFPKKSDKALFYLIHNDHFRGNLRMIYEELKKRNPTGTYVVVNKAGLFQGSFMNKIKGAFYFYFVLNYHFATASQIYLNDNFLPLAYMPVKKGTKILQFWHGIGAWKRFGLSTENREVTRRAVEKGNQKVTHLFVSGRNVVPFYKEAFGIEEEKIFPTGLPVLDFYFSEEKRACARREFYESYPQLQGKKLLLYTPTFRNSTEENENLQRVFDAKRLQKLLGEEWCILTRLHPSLRGTIAVEGDFAGVVDVSAYGDIKGLYEVANVLVNDYSSTMVEFALLRKPILLFAYDLEDYDRGFYRDYLENVPGNVVRTLEELAEEVKKEHLEAEKLERFLTLHYDYYDDKNTERVLDVIDGRERREN